MSKMKSKTTLTKTFLKSMATLLTLGKYSSTDLVRFGEDLVEAVLSEDNLNLVHKVLTKDRMFSYDFLILFRYDNTDNRFTHHQDYLSDCNILLGSDLKELNCLHMAIIINDDELCDYLLTFLTECASVSDDPLLLVSFLTQSCYNGNTPLHLASFFGMADLVRHLLELGANPNMRNALKYKPVDCADSDDTRNLFLNLATLAKHPLISGSIGDDLVLRNEIHHVVDQVESNNMNPSKVLADFKNNSPPITSFEARQVHSIEPVIPGTPDLVQRSNTSTPSSFDSLTIDFNDANSSLNNLLIPSQPRLISCLSKDKRSRRLYLGNRRIVFDSQTLLIHATQTNDLPLVMSTLSLYPSSSLALRELLEYRSARRNATYLHIACNYKNPDMVKYWLSKGLDINSVDKDGYTPLHVACGENERRCITLLIEDDNVIIDCLANDKRAPWDLTDSPVILNILHRAYLNFKKKVSNQPNSNTMDQLNQTSDRNLRIIKPSLEGIGELNTSAPTPTPAVSPKVPASRTPSYSSATIKLKPVSNSSVQLSNPVISNLMLPPPTFQLSSKPLPNPSYNQSLGQPKLAIQQGGYSSATIKLKPKAMMPTFSLNMNSTNNNGYLNRKLTMDTGNPFVKPPTFLTNQPTKLTHTNLFYN